MATGPHTEGHTELSLSTGSSDGSAFISEQVSLPKGYRTFSQTQDKSLPVFDLRRSNFPKAIYQNFSLTSISRSEVKRQVAEQFRAKEDRVLVYESRGHVEETLLQTMIIVLPENDPPSRLIIRIETLESLEQTHAMLRCTRVIQPTTVRQIRDSLLSELDWKDGALCRNGIVLNPETLVQELASGDLFCVQAIKSSLRPISLVFRPSPKSCYSYSLEVDAICTVQQLKSKFLKEFKDDLLIHEIKTGQVIHINFHEVHLQNDKCMGMVLRGSRDEIFSIHIAVPNAVCVTFKYRVQHGKRRVPYSQQIFIKPNCSTYDLRMEAAKYLGVDQKAVKLTINDKRIEEHENLQNENILKRGTSIHVGVKKKKTVQIRHPETQEECAISLYLLESVYCLKTEISNKFDIDPLQISLQCRSMEMKDKDSLLNYPIKNKMVLTMDIYHNRITILFWIIFKKVRVKLIIDDSSGTTVDDALTFCAVKYNYDRQHSKAIFQQRCLYKYNSLKQEGLESGSIIHVVYFENTQVEKDTIFMVKGDGHISSEKGIIRDGQIFYALKNVGTRSQEKQVNLNASLTLPGGIHMDDDIRDPEKQMQDRSSGRVKKPAESRNKVDKSKYLKKARALYQKKCDEEQTQRKLVDMGEDQPSSTVYHRTGVATHMSSGSEVVKEKTSLDGMLDSQKKSAHFYLSGDDSSTQLLLNHAEEKSDTSSEERSNSDSETDSEEDSSSHFNTHLDNDQLSPDQNRQSIERDAGIFMQKLSSGYSSSENMNDVKVLHRPDISSTDDSTSDMNCSSSSHDKATETIFDLNLERFNRDTGTSNPIQCPCFNHYTSNPIRCPYLSVVKFYQDRGNFPQRPRRQRCQTVGETNIAREFSDHIHWQTVPALMYQFPEQKPNCDLETAGISSRLLDDVSYDVGRKWKQLARKLQVDERETDRIEHDNPGLREQSMQSLISWKRSGGTKANREQLFNALRSIGLESVVEKCEISYGYNTA